MILSLDVPDIRNSQVPDIVNELKEYGISPEVHDPLVDHEEAFNEIRHPHS